MDKPLEEFTHHGFTIKVFPDYDFQAESPNDCNDDLQLVHFHRDFYIESDAMSEDDCRRFYQGEKVEQLKKFRIYPVTAYIHSGVMLYLGNISHPFDAQGWDTSHVGAVLVSKDTWKSKKKADAAAQSFIDEWNSINNGEIYYYVIEDSDGETVASCGGFIGDIKYCRDEAKSAATWEYNDRRKKHNAQRKEQIRHHTPLERREAFQI